MNNKVLHIVITIILALNGYTTVYAQELPKSLSDSMSLLMAMEDGEYSIRYKSIDYLVEIKEHNLSGIRIPLFTNELCSSFDKKVLTYIEEACADYMLSLNGPRFSEMTFVKGSWNDVLSYTDDFSFSLSEEGAGQCQAEWGQDGKTVLLNFPFGYDKANKGTRSEIEDRFIYNLKRFCANEARPLPEVPLKELQELGDNLFVLKGESYNISEVNGNMYFSLNEEGVPEEFMNPECPIPTFANIIILGNGYGGNIELKVSKHEYGKSETFTVPLESLIQYCISQGCKVYWGVEECRENLLIGTIFLYNPSEMYDHVVRVELNPQDIGADNFVVKGRASLFIPTNNVQNLFQEYKQKGDDEKIKY